MNFPLYHVKVGIEELYFLSHAQRRGLTQVFTYYFMYMFFHIHPCISVFGFLRK